MTSELKPGSAGERPDGNTTVLSGPEFFDAEQTVAAYQATATRETA